MSNSVLFVSGFSILLPAVLAIARFRNIDEMFHPFIFCLWLGSVNEALSYAMILTRHSNALNSNIYVLFESLLIIWQFKKWKVFGSLHFLFPLLLILLSAAWIGENFLWGSIYRFSSYYRMLYAMVIVVLSIHLFNRIMVTERPPVLKSPILLICIVFVVYFTYRILVEAYWLYGLNYSMNLRNNVYFVVAIINLLANLIYLFAIAWMPRKNQFILSF